MTGIARSTWHYRAKPRARVTAPVHQRERAYPARISATERDVIAAEITTGWVQGHSVDHTFAAAWDAGTMLASRRSWWRIAAAIEDQGARPIAPTRRGSVAPRQAPVLTASGPGEVWSWDITDLRSPWRGIAFKAYSIIDIYSRMIVGWRVEERESDQLAVDLFEKAITDHGPPAVVHADSGPAMRSTLLKEFLSSHSIRQTHNRPRVSNDNPFSESEFRTMKYRPNYPATFEDLATARRFLTGYVPWYNHHHKHSGIALFSPAAVHDGTWQDLWHHRDQTQQDYYAAHPERIRGRPRTPTPADLVGINHQQHTDEDNNIKRLHTA